VGGTSNLGPVGNVTITGGTNGQVLTTNGSGVLTWSSAAGGGVANGTSNVLIPTVDGNVEITSGGNTTLVVTPTGANVAGTLNVTGTSNLGPVGNVTITGGATGQVLTTDGSGVLTWSSAAGGGVANGTSNVNVVIAPTAGVSQSALTSVSVISLLSFLSTYSRDNVTAIYFIYLKNKVKKASF
jgi:hypothetical protein